MLMEQLKLDVEAETKRVQVEQAKACELEVKYSQSMDDLNMTLLKSEEECLR